MTYSGFSFNALRAEKMRYTICMTKGTHILIVEDDEFMASILSKELQGAGAEVTHAASAEKGMEALEKKIPDLLILDILLPGMSGLDALAKIRGDAKTKHLPIIIASNFASDAQIKQAQSLGVQSYLIKSATTPPEILAEVEKVLAAVKKA